jgi:predicted alpha/beta superfamily hydrolase
MSPSVWWDDCAVYKIVDAIDETAKPPLKIWLDTGTREEGWERARELRDRLVLKGWRLHDDLHYLEADGSDHSEGAWAARIETVLRFLFPPAPPGIEPSRRPRMAAVREKLRLLSNRAKGLTKVR